jgi:ABC-type antimicrobial peptide transport system permease subunit
VLTTGLVLGVTGVAAGAAVALATSRVLWATIPGFGELDIQTIGGVSVAVVLIAAFAAWLPARAATRVDPAVALRCE